MIKSVVIAALVAGALAGAALHSSERASRRPVSRSRWPRGFPRPFAAPSTWGIATRPRLTRKGGRDAKPTAGYWSGTLASSCTVWPDARARLFALYAIHLQHD